MSYKKILFLMAICLVGIQIHVGSPTCQPLSSIPLEALPADYAGIIFLFSHGVAGTKDQVNLYVKAGIIESPYSTFDYPDSASDINLGNIDHLLRDIERGWHKLARGVYKNSSLAQEGDIAVLKKNYDYIRQKWPKAQIILVGLSRGAATIDTFLGTYTVENVVAIISDSGFDTVGTVIKLKRELLGVTKVVSQAMGQGIMEMIFQGYKRTGISPLKALNKQDFSIARLIICSKEDNLVPYWSSVNLYNNLLKLGHKKVHIFIAPKGQHGKILAGPYRDQYRQIVHAFYKKYDLPHQSLLAEAGESLFNNCQPPHLIIKKNRA